MRASPVAQQVKNLPAMQKMQETWIQSLGQEDSLDKEMASHSRILACRMPWRATVHEVTKSWTRLKWLSTHAPKSSTRKFYFPQSKMRKHKNEVKQSKKPWKIIKSFSPTCITFLKTESTIWKQQTTFIPRTSLIMSQLNFYWLDQRIKALLFLSHKF